MSRVRNFCFTSFDLDSKINSEFENVVYIIYQHEVSPSTQKRHVQGYCELRNAMSIAAIQKKIFQGVKVHIERRKGTSQQASDYCKKTESAVIGTQFSRGEMSEQGFRTDLETLVEMASSGSGVMDIVLEHPQVIRFVRNIQLVGSMVEPPIRCVEVELMTPEEIQRLETRPFFHLGDWSSYDNQKAVVFQGPSTDIRPVVSGQRLRFPVFGQPDRVCWIEKVYLLVDEKRPPSMWEPILRMVE